ncbi:MAG: zinc-ribbon domain-containing protein, partial [Candidatus Helarchaeota archaeon]
AEIWSLLVVGVALLIVAITLGQGTTSKRSIIEDSTTEFCPNCGSSIAKNSKFCPYCQAKL